MARPKKHEDDRHVVQVNINLTEKQKSAYQALADYRDVPLQVLLRSVIVRELDVVVSTVAPTLTAHLNQ